MAADPEPVTVAAAAAYRILHPKLYALAMAIQRHEGYFKGSLAWRNNNPGNLRSSPLATGTNKGMAVFPDYYVGLAALMRDLWGKCTGHTSTGLDGNSTLAALIGVYAPPVENDTKAYVASVCAETDFRPEMKLRDLL
jgi:hypothetical protein